MPVCAVVVVVVVVPLTDNPTEHCLCYAFTFHYNIV